ncbi:MAG: O-antigen polysaccharide polymerase Wzy family protein [Clostridia bacterium]|nr:O-antigen polysaccharide polymerase Wzy family protein [Clostridia bacterium]
MLKLKSFKSPTLTKSICFIGLALIFTLVSFLCQVPPLFIAVMLVWGAFTIYTLFDLANRAAPFVFLIAFFLFLLGGDFAELYMGYPQEFSFASNIDNHAYISIIISLVSIFASFYISGKLLNRKNKEPKKLDANHTDYMLKFRNITCIGFYVTVIPKIATTVDAALYTINNGYLSYYTEYKSRLPEIVESISDLFPLFLFAFLATLPSKKQCFFPILIYLTNSVLALLTGRRIMFGATVLVLVFYFIARHKLNPEEQWLDKKKIIIALVACPIVLFLMYMQRYVRYGDAIEGGTLFDIIFRFFSQQGTSINTIKFQKVLEGDPLKCTSLYYTLYYLRGNLITGHFFDFPMELYLQRSIDTVYRTNCLADYIMYSVNADDFFKGYGLGTSYIAELYHDLGHLGIALGSFIYGFLFNWLFSLKKFSYWKFALGLLMLEEFVILPRYGADVIMRPFYSLTILTVLIILIIIYHYLKKRNKSAL